MELIRQDETEEAKLNIKHMRRGTFKVRQEITQNHDKYVCNKPACMHIALDKKEAFKCNNVAFSFCNLARRKPDPCLVVPWY